jgi:DNA end-binding protein Ku
MDLIQKKAKGKQIEAPAPSEEPAEVVDLMEALKQSLSGGGERRSPARAKDRRSAPATRSARRSRTRERANQPTRKTSRKLPRKARARRR